MRVGSRSGGWVGLREVVLQDWAANSHSAKSRLSLASLRLATYAPRPLRAPARVLHRLLVEWVLGIEISWEVTVGSGLVLHHGQGIVVNEGSTLGRNCVIRQGVTIGRKATRAGAPRIGDDVNLGAHCIVIGDVQVGNGAVIGAGAVVTKDIPAGETWAGNPALRLRAKPTH